MEQNAIARLFRHAQRNIFIDPNIISFVFLTTTVICATIIPAGVEETGQKVDFYSTGAHIALNMCGAWVLSAIIIDSLHVLHLFIYSANGTK
jgi:hypothetical protein